MGAGREFEGKSLGEALRAAADALGRPAREIDYEVVAEGRRGMFGLGARRVRIWVDLPEGMDPAVASAQDLVPGAPPAEDVAWADETIRAVLHGIGLEISAHVTVIQGGVRAELAGPDRKLLTARDGELLAALQFLLTRMARQSRPGAGRIVIECRGYRDQRDREVIGRAREAARHVASTGELRALGPMNPYERRLVHVTVQEFPGLATRSVGEGFLKSVEILLAPSKGEA
jgi:spoIIIJ-associated protein